MNAKKTIALVILRVTAPAVESKPQEQAQAKTGHTSGVATQAYRDGYERIFGGKEKSTLN